MRGPARSIRSSRPIRRHASTEFQRGVVFPPRQEHDASPAAGCDISPRGVASAGGHDASAGEASRPADRDVSTAQARHDGFAPGAAARSRPRHSAMRCASYAPPRGPRQRARMTSRAALRLAALRDQTAGASTTTSPMTTTVIRPTTSTSAPVETGERTTSIAISPGTCRIAPLSSANSRMLGINLPTLLVGMGFTK